MLDEYLELIELHTGKRYFVAVGREELMGGEVERAHSHRHTRR